MANYTGQPGNALPVVGQSTDTALMLGIQVGLRRPTVAIGTTSYTVSSTQTGTLFTYGGIGSACSIVLPSPEAGLWFEFAATGAIAASGTKFNCAYSTSCIIGNMSSAGEGTWAFGATTQEFVIGGMFVEVFGLSTANYYIRHWKGGATAASTNCLKPAS